MEVQMRQYEPSSITDEFVDQQMKVANEEEFVQTARSAYTRIGGLAREICGNNASALDLKITSLALLHDYFSFLQTKTN